MSPMISGDIVFPLKSNVVRLTSQPSLFRAGWSCRWLNPHFKTTEYASDSKIPMVIRMAAVA